MTSNVNVPYSGTTFPKTNNTSRRVAMLNTIDGIVTGRNAKKSNSDRPAP